MATLRSELPVVAFLCGHWTQAGLSPSGEMEKLLRGSPEKRICVFSVVVLVESIPALLWFKVRREATGPSLEFFIGHSWSSEHSRQPPWKGLPSPLAMGLGDPILGQATPRPPAQCPAGALYVGHFFKRGSRLSSAGPLWETVASDLDLDPVAGPLHPADGVKGWGGNHKVVLDAKLITTPF